MPPLSNPEKPLKILTIDGGGLQAISTLLILDKLLNSIAAVNGVPHRKPRPCDVFDTIAGIGAGGWLALLLGRFHMDITACLSEWYKITQCIAPRSKAEEMRMRVFQHCYFDPERLVEQIDDLTQVYGTSENLIAGNTDGVRTRHVFVAALRSDGRGYNLFRTYKIPKDAKLPLKLLAGPENPSTFKISRAFGVTGASKYFTPEWKERMAGSIGKTSFSNTRFPKPHNITKLALDEMWGIYGVDVPLSVVVNIGPGLPNTFDVRQIAQRFSWGLSAPRNESVQYKRPRSPMIEPEPLKKKRTLPKSNFNMGEPDPPAAPVRFDESADKENSRPASDDRRRSLAKVNTFGSIRDRGIEDKLKKFETDIEQDVKAKLGRLYKGGESLYFRLAPDQAPRGTARNDSSAPGLAMDGADTYLNNPIIAIKMDELAQRMVTAAA